MCYNFDNQYTISSDGVSTPCLKKTRGNQPDFKKKLADLRAGNFFPKKADDEAGCLDIR
jgi:hypothetical protein